MQMQNCFRISTLAVSLLLSLTACDGSNGVQAVDTSPAIATPAGTPQALAIGARATINAQEFELEVARTSQEQQIGLMFRPSLAPNRGMVFPFEPARPVSFWMHNVLIPLDIIFIRDDVVVGIEAALPGCPELPCPGYGPDVSVDTVLELAGDRAAELGLVVGDRLEIEYF